MKSIITLQLVCKTWIIKKLLSKTTENKETNKQTNKPKQNKTPLTEIKHTQFLIE